MQVTGSLDRDIVRRIMRAHINELRYCYQKGLQQRPNLAGRLSLAFVVDLQGRVAMSAVQKSTLTDPSVGQCVAAAARRWAFPKPTGEGVVKVVAPFEFRPGG